MQFTGSFLDVLLWIMEKDRILDDQIDGGKW